MHFIFFFIFNLQNIVLERYASFITFHPFVNNNLNRMKIFEFSSIRYFVLPNMG